MRNLVGWSAALAVGLGVFGGAPERALAATPNLIVHVYDVGQGSCVLVECPDDLPILIDCGKMGSGGDVTGAARKINAVLDGYGGQYQPLRVILSHGDVDHYSLLSAKDTRGRSLLDPKRVRQVYFGGAYADYGAAKSWINAAHRSLSFPPKDYPPDRPCDDPSLRISCFQPNETAWGSIRGVACGPAKLDLLSANAQAYYRAHPNQFGADWESDGRKNADSAVVRVSYDGVSFIFPGDAQEITEQMILRNAQAAGVSLAGTGFLFGSHHGARLDGSNGAAWIAGTAPRNVVFSANLGGRHGHPTCTVVLRFDTLADVSLTDAPGAMPVRCDRELEPRNFKNRFLVTEATGDITITVQAGRPPTVICDKPTKGCAW
jgi:beta-lactamase superfamily II metal-dependent hydrolase